MTTPLVTAAGRCEAGRRKSIHRMLMAGSALVPALMTGSLLASTGAFAQALSTGTPPASASVNGTAATATPAAAAPPKTWLEGITYGAQVEGGVTGNFDRPADGLNYGRLFDDKANTALLNSVQLTATRAIDPTLSTFDFGFMLQGTYGSDARYTHYLGEFGHVTNDRNQFSILQANVTMHAPVLFKGGIDFKLGQFATLIGYETIDPSTNPFYSHSYNFNFGPFEHTGLIAEAHLNPTVDLYGEIDTGESTTFGNGDNNAKPAGLVGVGLNSLAGGKLTVLAFLHLGPEDATNAIGHEANSSMRYEGDVVATYKATDKLTLVAEAQWQHDDFYGADSYGLAGYASYALTPTLTANFRGEVYRDNAGFFVAAFPGNTDAYRGLNGLSTTAFGAGRQTYSEWTWGVSYKPVIPHVALLAFRPEIRWDKSFSGGHPYNALTNTGNFTLAADVILGF
ncbi:porin [Lichenicola cladoniae]|uniref:Porin n=1 Tax=Lichenicola cladoniae TaxID=1484109 RepID=A0A6M8HMT5_9PROT|nr:outer membrane beta-barrel protein [Lichenicola cladoniae]NPD67209.1 porin [Acetobacteraceae bacterium]QKE89723.1 porin [Lichenicola cladoniae]